MKFQIRFFRGNVYFFLKKNGFFRILFFLKPLTERKSCVIIIIVIARTWVWDSFRKRIPAPYL